VIYDLERDEGSIHQGNSYPLPKRRSVFDRGWVEIYAVYEDVKSQTGERMTPQFRQCVVDSSVDLSIIRSWLQQCDQKHGDPTSNHLSSTQSKYLRLHDLKKQCLIKTAPNARYVTLSYQWGRHSDICSNFSTTHANIEERRQVNGLKINDIRLPLSIRDAFSVAKLLGEKFVWVDGICIIQDCSEDKRKQIKHMSSVYSKL
jgi:hypothetical protein